MNDIFIEINLRDPKKDQTLLHETVHSFEQAIEAIGRMEVHYDTLRAEKNCPTCGFCDKDCDNCDWCGTKESE